MEEKKISLKDVEGFVQYLTMEEKSAATIGKYRHDVLCLVRFAAGRVLDKALLLEYKAWLVQRYAVESVNSMPAAVNSFLRCMKRPDCCIRQLKMQRTAYCPQDKELKREEYERLVAAAGKKRSQQLCLLLQTICATGIRVSELSQITLEAVRCGEAVITCKGKTRRVFLPVQLRKKLLHFAREQHIGAGPLFVTRSGRPLDRCSIWRQMKALCERAGVAASKVLPHNLRHLFARTFYRVHRDIVKLADLLGHSNINTTRIYTISTGAEHRKKIECLRLVL